LGDLGEVVEMYDEVVSSCMWDSLDNVVVEDVEAAEHLLEFLKTNEIGRVSCIILQSIGYLAEYMGISKNEFPVAMRVFDMIKAKGRNFAVAFYYVLRDTFFIKDHAEGMKFAMGNDGNRKKVISEHNNGYIIYEMSGLMEGRPKKKGGFTLNYS
jgi:structural maintenance of chromosome 4